MMKRSLRMAGLVVVAAVGMAGAHLTDGSLVPAGGETLKVGDTFTIAWHEQFNHDVGVDIALSEDGGTTWKDIKTGIADGMNGDKTFKWTVAGTTSTTSKIRICQHDSAPNGKACTDADNVSDPIAGTGGHYVLVSKAFSIGTGTDIRPNSSEVGSFSIDFHSDSRNVDIFFGLTESKDVQLQAFDTQGRLLATLVQGAFATGNHKLSLFSNRLDNSNGSLIFKLKVGDQVRTQSWNAVR